jgi:hypothetical protein
MPYALTTKPYSCWGCDYFVLSQGVEGWCRRRAPDALDLYPHGSTCLLTAKGDILTHNTTDCVRLPVGADGTVLTADATQPDGVKWAAGAAPAQTWMQDFQAGMFAAPEAAGGRLDLTRNNQTNSATNPVVASDSATYDDAAVLPFLTAEFGKVVAVEIAVTASAVPGLTVPADPYLRILITSNDGTSETIDGHIDVPVPQAYVNSSDNVVTANYYNATLFVTPQIVLSHLPMGFAIDLGDESVERQIHNVRGITVRVYVKGVPIPDEELALKSLSNEDEDVPTGETAEAMEAIETPAEETEEKTLESSPPYLGSIDPNTISSGESLAKWCTIKVAPNEWCGEYKPASKTVPPVPPFVYPEPTPP